MTRIIITGGPRTGKTTLARRLSDEEGLLLCNPPVAALPVNHTDDLMSLGWSEASQAASLWLDAPGPWIVEGVGASRAVAERARHHHGVPMTQRAEDAVVRQLRLKLLMRLDAIVEARGTPAAIAELSAAYESLATGAALLGGVSEVVIDGGEPS